MMIQFIITCNVLLQLLNAKKYIAVNELTDGRNADTRCMALYGTHLATITDNAENELAADACRSLPRGICWIGMYRDSPSSQNWYWRSDRNLAVSFTSWLAGQPQTRENCVAFWYARPGSSKWGDVWCNNGVERHYPFICDAPTYDPLVFAHYMAWFQVTPQMVHWPPNSGMYYEPIIGYYSSDDITTIKWQLSLMESVGINGIIVDWYGIQQLYDYPFIKDATEIMWNEIKTNHPNFKLAILYDLNSQNTDEQKFTDSLNYLNDNYFNHNQYLKDDQNNPILLLWPSSESDASIQTPDGLNTILSSAGLSDVNIYVEFDNPAFSWGVSHSYTNLGIFNWVYPWHKSTNQQTVINEVKQDIIELFNVAESQPYNSNLFLQSMYIGFNDHYHYNLDLIDADNDYLNVIADYLDEIYNDQSNNIEPVDTYLIQLPTWNDYTEGTMIEPHVPTSGCVHGCALNTEQDPYYYLLQLHKIFVNPYVNEANFKQNLQAITNRYFPNLFGRFTHLYINQYPDRILIQNAGSNDCITYDGSGYTGLWYDTNCNTLSSQQQWILHAVNNPYPGWFRIKSSSFNRCVVNRAHNNALEYVAAPDGWTFSMTGGINDGYTDQFWSIHNYNDANGQFMLKSYAAQKCMHQSNGKFGIAPCVDSQNDQKWTFIVADV